MPTNGIVPLDKCAEYLANASKYSNDDLSDTEILVLTLVHTQKRLTISELVLLVRNNPVIARTFLDPKHVIQAVHSLDKLGYIKYQIVEY
jgi:hypothetical protein